MLRQKLKVCHIPEVDACNSYLRGFIFNSINIP